MVDISIHLPPHVQELCNHLILENIGEDLGDVASARDWLPQQETRRFDYRYRQLRELLVPYHHELELLPKPTRESGLIPDELLQRFGSEIDDDPVPELDLDGADLVEEENIVQAFQHQLQNIALTD